MMSDASRERTNRAPAQAGALFSIGGVAEATGLSVDTIRAWERRYGRPTAIRLPSGHRRYAESQVRWLRRVAEALAHGHRPSQVLRLDEAALDRMLEERLQQPADRTTAAYVELVRGFRRSDLLARLEAEWQRLRPHEFLECRIVPLLEAVGRLWADGELHIRHEHFLTEALEDLLRALRAGLPESDAPFTLVLATLPGETHGLGLQMTALLAALHGVGVHILGTNVPIDEIRRTMRETGAHAAVVSVSLATGGVETDRLLGELRGALPAGTHLLVGGAGARGPRRGARGVDYLAGLVDFERWLARTAERRIRVRHGIHAFSPAPTADPEIRESRA